MERLRHIYDARQEFQKARQKADQLRAEEGWPLWKKENYVYRAFQRYFFEVEGLMERHPSGGHYLEEVKLGMVLPPGADPDDPPEDTRFFVGLRSMTDSYKPIPTDGYTSPSSGRERATDGEVQVTVPEKVVTKAFRQVNEFVAEVGLDADMDEETQDAGFDYSDILEEGPPGTGDAPDITADGMGTDE
jgi:hypothetical protein